MNEASAKQRAAAWVAIVFLLGASLGGVVGYIFAHRAVSASMMESVSQRRAHKVEQLTRLAHLNPDQRQQLDGILNELHAEYKTLDDERDETRQKYRNKIRGILTQDQISGYEEFLREMDEERKRMTPPQ
jgi:hypothetical protein